MQDRVRDAFKIIKKDLRTMSQKDGGGPHQIPKFLACEIGTWGRGLGQTLICPIFNFDLRTKGDLWRGVPLQAIMCCYPLIICTNQKVTLFAIQQKIFIMSQILIGGRGSKAKHKIPKCWCPKVAMEWREGGIRSN